MRHSLSPLRSVLLLLCAFTTFVSSASAQGGAVGAKVPVTVENFIRAETDTYFKSFVGKAGLGRLLHNRTPVSVDSQDVIRLNLDTFYSSGVFDLDAAPVTITLPNGGGRFMSLLAISQDHYAQPVVYAPGRYTFTRKQMGTRYFTIVLRTFVDPASPADIAAAHALQDQVVVQQASTGRFEIPDWDTASLGKVRDALLVLAALQGEAKPRFGRASEVDAVSHLIGTAAGWGGNPREAADYVGGAPAANDGKTVHRMTVSQVPVDGFWSVSVYNAKGYFEKNDLGVYAFNNITAKPSADGSVTLQFGGCGPGVANCIPITPGWNYLARMYRPRKAILDGTWKFPKPVPVK